MADFKILRGSTIIPGGQPSITINEGVDFTLETGIADSAWWFQITNSALTGMGDTVGGGNQNVDDITVYADVGSTSITLTRVGTANPNRVDWQIIQYTGAPGGVNEFIVREKGFVTTTGTATGSIAVPGSVVSESDLVPFITGQNNNTTNRNGQSAVKHTAEISGGNVTFTRGWNTGTSNVSYALVEFTGSNWTITREEFTGTTQTYTLGTPVADITQTFIHRQYRYNLSNTAGLDDMSQRVRLISTTSIDIRSTTTNDASLKVHVIWLIQNPDMLVSRYIGTMVGTGEEEIFNVPISAVANTDLTYLTVSNDCTGGGTAFPRGYINVLLTSATNVLMRQSDNGQTSQYSIEVVEFPEGGVGPPPAGNIVVNSVNQVLENSDISLGETVSINQSGSFMVVAVQFYSEQALLPGDITATYNSVAMNPAAVANPTSTNSVGTAIFTLAGPATGPNDFTLSVPTNLRSQTVTHYDLDNVDSIGGSGANVDPSGATATTSVATTRENSFVIFSAAQQGTGLTGSVTGITERNEGNSNAASPLTFNDNFYLMADDEYESTGVVNPIMTWPDTLSTAVAIVELQAPIVGTFGIYIGPQTADDIVVGPTLFASRYLGIT